MQNELFVELCNIINKKNKGDSQSTINDNLKSFQLLLDMVKFIVEGTAHQHLQTINKCFTMLNEQRACRIPIQLAMQNLKQISFIVCENKKPQQIKQQKRAYAIMGRALSVFKRKKSTEYSQQQEKRQQLTQQLQNILFRLYYEDKLILSKNQSHLLEDIQLKFDLFDDTLEPSYFGNQVYGLFIGVPKTVVMVLPYKLNRSQNINFLRGSLLHVYLDFSHVIEKISQKVIFYKNSILRGIYFIQEGEVEVTSGRVVARGWVISGKCRSSGYGWKFKPLYFIKFIAKNTNIWKHFYNDSLLNLDYPFKLTNILELQEQQQQFTSISKKKGVRLPKLNSLSFSLDKYQQIQKMRHYDDKISHLYLYKQNLLEKKMGGIRTPVQNFNAVISNNDNSKQLRKAKYLNNKNKITNKNVASNSSDNILIKSVLKRLQNIVSNGQKNRHKNDNSKSGMMMMINGNDRKKTTKIKPLQLQRKIKWDKKIKYDGK